jgi:osmotically-inducible protein OsmY
MMHKPDHMLEAQVRTELLWDPKVLDSRIVVKAHDGSVILSGTVDTLAEAQLASEDAACVVGVKAVDNQLLVGPTGGLATDLLITADCVAALDAERLVPHGAVNAVVKEGWVTLTGEVHRHFQRQAARHAVARVPGVVGVTNQVALTDEPIAPDVADRTEKTL